LTKVKGVCELTLGNVNVNFCIIAVNSTKVIRFGLNFGCTVQQSFRTPQIKHHQPLHNPTYATMTKSHQARVKHTQQKAPPNTMAQPYRYNPHPIAHTPYIDIPVSVQQKSPTGPSDTLQPSTGTANFNTSTEMSFKDIIGIDDTSSPPDNKWQQVLAKQKPKFSKQHEKHDLLNQSYNTRSTTQSSPISKSTVKQQKLIRKQHKSKLKNDQVCITTFKQYKPTPNYSLTIDINDMHQHFGHANEKYLVQTANYYNIKLIGKLNPCLDCAIANIKQSPISKSTNPRCQVPGQQLFIDISKLSHQSTVGSSFWLLILDDATNVAWSIFLRHKDDQYERILHLIRSLQQQHTPISFIW
jgi:hypothetical protein